MLVHLHTASVTFIGQGRRPKFTVTEENVSKVVGAGFRVLLSNRFYQSEPNIKHAMDARTLYVKKHW